MEMCMPTAQQLIDALDKGEPVDARMIDAVISRKQTGLAYELSRKGTPEIMDHRSAIFASRRRIVGYEDVIHMGPKGVLIYTPAVDGQKASLYGREPCGVDQLHLYRPEQIGF